MTKYRIYARYNNGLLPFNLRSLVTERLGLPTTFKVEDLGCGGPNTRLSQVFEVEVHCTADAAIDFANHLATLDIEALVVEVLDVQLPNNCDPDDLAMVFGYTLTEHARPIYWNHETCPIHRAAAEAAATERLRIELTPEEKLKARIELASKQVEECLENKEMSIVDQLRLHAYLVKLKAKGEAA